MLSKLRYTGNLRCEAVHLRSGSEIQTDAPVDNKGKGERFSPTDLVGVALATCILTTMGIAANTHDINIDGTECELEKIMLSDPRRIGELKVRVIFPKGKVYSDKEKTLMENTGRTCPVARSLNSELVQTLDFIWP